MIKSLLVHASKHGVPPRKGTEMLGRGPEPGEEKTGLFLRRHWPYVWEDGRAALHDRVRPIHRFGLRKAVVPITETIFFF